MGITDLISGFVGTKKSKGSLKFDPALGDKDAEKMREELKKGGWRNSYAFLEKTKDAQDRDFYLEALSNWSSTPPWFELWERDAPDSSTKHLMEGAYLIHSAWNVRGAGLAASVGEDAARQFFDLLTDADVALHQAARLDPTDPTPWARMLITARGLQFDLEDTQQRFDEVIARDPLHRSAHSQMLQRLAAKWGGSNQLMFKFVRDRLANTPAGHMLNGLLAEAHVERWLSHLIESEADEAEGYFTKVVVKKELLTAAQRSVLKPELKTSRHTLLDQNYFAFCFWKAGEKKLARQLLLEVDDRFTELPWAYLGKAGEIFEQANQWCGL